MFVNLLSDLLFHSDSFGCVFVFDLLFQILDQYFLIIVSWGLDLNQSNLFVPYILSTSLLPSLYTSTNNLKTFLKILKHQKSKITEFSSRTRVKMILMKKNKISSNLRFKLSLSLGSFIKYVASGLSQDLLT
jgi:hypothetical protein